MLLEANGLRVPAQAPSGRDPLAGPVHVSLQAGRAVGVYGPSGCGKSTLLRALALLEPNAQGQVLFHGRQPRGDGVPAYRRRVVLVGQTPMRLPGTVLHNLRAPFELRAARGCAFDELRARALCHALGLEDEVLARPAASLSGGEAQRMALVRALLLEPEVLMLDEFSASLDPVTRAAAEQAVLEFRRAASGRGLIVVSHDLAQRERLVDDLLALDAAGHMVRQGGATWAPAS